MLNCKTGTVEGTTGVAISITVGFKPDAVLLMNVDDAHGGTDLWWTTNMGAGYGRKIVTSTTNTTDLSLISSNGVTATDNGFTIGTDGQVNIDSETIFWIAWRSNE